MQTSQSGIKFIEANEGFCPIITPDSKGEQIGYGHNLLPGEQVKYAHGITQAEAENLLEWDLSTRFEPAVNRLCSASHSYQPGWFPSQNQFDALVDFCYNEGPGDLAIMMSHGWDSIPVEIPRWCYEKVKGVEVESPGLKDRRLKEVALFNTAPVMSPELD